MPRMHFTIRKAIFSCNYFLFIFQRILSPLGSRKGCIGLPVADEDDANRDLHSKALLIEGDRHDLLMIGSSNFTPHGMGVGVYNCEANLAFEDKTGTKRGGMAMVDRLGLPVDWDDGFTVDDVAWQPQDEMPLGVSRRGIRVKLPWQ